MAEKEYIEREDALSAQNKSMNLSECRKRIERIPAADVRPVVLCKDCKWCHAGYCERYDDLIPFGCAYKPWKDWFCADGKKREES